jgi:hypothetical protein
MSRARHLGCSILLCHVRVRSGERRPARKMIDAGMDRKRTMEITGHKTGSMFDRYNIGKQEDIEATRRQVEG